MGYSTVSKIQDFITNLILLVYVGILLIYKGIGYSYFMAALKALVLVFVLFLMIFSLWIFYHWVIREGDKTKEPVEEEPSNEEQTVMNEQHQNI